LSTCEWAWAEVFDGYSDTVALEPLKDVLCQPGVRPWVEVPPAALDVERVTVVVVDTQHVAFEHGSRFRFLEPLRDGGIAHRRKS
jgi:hypothetical protein